MKGLMRRGISVNVLYAGETYTHAGGAQACLSVFHRGAPSSRGLGLQCCLVRTLSTGAGFLSVGARSLCALGCLSCELEAVCP